MRQENVRRLAAGGALALVCAAAGCSSLDDVNVDVCGNGIVEGTEDCDAVAGSAACGGNNEANPEARCAFLCPSGATEQCAELRAGYVCGADRVCRTPSGSFAEAPGSPFRGGAFFNSLLTSGDVDGDGAADLAFVDPDRSEATVRFAPALAGSLEVLAPIDSPRLGTPAVVDIDQNGLADLLVNRTFGGPQPLLGAADHTLAAPVETGLPVPGVAPATSVLILQTLEQEARILVHAGRRLQLFDFDPFSGTTAGATLEMPGALAAEPAFEPFPVADLDGDGRLDVLIVLRDSPALFVLRGVADDGNNHGFELVTVPLPGRTADLIVPTGVGLLDPADTRPTLALWRARDPGDEIVLLRPASPAGPGSLDFVVEPARTFDVPGFGDPTTDLARECGAVEAIAELTPEDGLGLGDLVCSIGGGGGLVMVQQPDGSFLGTYVVSFNEGFTTGAVQVADLNADGQPDLVAASRSSVDVHLGQGGGRFASFRTPVARSVGRLQLADFNGDRVLDIAAIPEPDQFRDGLMFVLFGTGSGVPEPPVDVPAPGALMALSTGVLRRGLFDSFADARADVAVIEQGPGGSTNLAVLQGSSQRYLLSPITLPDARAVAQIASAQLEPATGEGGGTFATVVQEEDFGTIGVRVVSGGLGRPGGSPLSVEIESRDPGEAFSLSASILPARLASGGPVGGVIATTAPFSFAPARLSAVVLADDGALAVSGLDLGLTDLLPPALVVVDLDGDALDEVIASSPGRLFGDAQGNDDPGEVQLFASDGAGVLSATATIAATNPGGLALLGAVADGTAILFVSSAAGLLAVPIGVDGTLGEPQTIDVPSGGSLATGDFDGDGLVDLAVSSREQVHVYRSLARRANLDGQTFVVKR